MTVLSLTREDQDVQEYDALREARHPDARAARDQADWLLWLELGGLSPRTIADYEKATSVALRPNMVPNKAFEEFTDGDLLHIAATFPPGSRRTRMAAYASWFDWGYRTRRLNENPFKRMPKMRRSKQKYIETFTDAEILLLQSLPLPDGPLMTILFETGIRKAEARHIRPMDFKPEAYPDAPYGRLVVLDGKGGKDRVILATHALKVALTELAVLENIPQGHYYWYGINAGSGYRNTIRDRVMAEGVFHRWWVRCITEAGVRYRNPHTTRHTFATRWLRRGGRLETLSIAMGHASIKTTFDLYGHLDDRDVARDMATIRAYDEANS